MDVQNLPLQLCVVLYMFSVRSVWVSYENRENSFLKILSPIDAFVV